MKACLQSRSLEKPFFYQDKFYQDPKEKTLLQSRRNTKLSEMRTPKDDFAVSGECSS
jgi:hypothetical protein